MAETMTRAAAAEQFKISRTFDAPRDLVFRTWTEPEHLEQWWGPVGFKLTVKKLELRPGGVFHYEMRSGTDNVMWGRITYHEISSPERIVCVTSFANERGEPVRAPMSETWPMEWLAEILFKETGGKTVLTISSYPIHATETERQTFIDGFKSMEGGYGATFDQLDKYLAELKKGGER